MPASKVASNAQTLKRSNAQTLKRSNARVRFCRMCGNTVNNEMSLKAWVEKIHARLVFLINASSLTNLMVQEVSTTDGYLNGG